MSHLLQYLQIHKISPIQQAFHHPAFMGNCQTISPTFYSPIYPVDERNEEVGLVWDNISLFFVWCESSSLLRLKNLGCKGSIACVLYRLKPRSSEGDQQGDTSWVWYYVLIVVGSRLIPYIHGLMNNATELNRRRPSPIPWRTAHHSVNSSEITKFLLKANDGRGERPSWAILSAIYASAKTWQHKGHISSHCLYGQALCT